jgi:hypothetical protein
MGFRRLSVELSDGRVEYFGEAASVGGEMELRVTTANDQALTVYR